LKNDAFSWTQEATQTFEKIEEAMCQTPMLATPYFTKTFSMECDTSRQNIGEI
jgi:hypothetical protein